MKTKPIDVKNIFENFQFQVLSNLTKNKNKKNVYSLV